MKHGISKVKFKGGQDANQALMRKLVVNFIATGRLSTTLAKAKVLKGHIDRLVYKASQGKESDKNVLLRKLGSTTVVKHMLTVVGPSFVGQTSGYTKMFRLAPRQGDNADTARLEWVKPLIEIKKADAVESKEKKVEKKASKKVAVEKTKTK